MTEQNGTTSAPESATPRNVHITSPHLILTSDRHDGSDNCVHALENNNLSVTLDRGQGTDQQIPTTNTTGHVVIAVGVDGDHDEVHYDGVGVSAEALLRDALEALETSLVALQRVGQA